MASIREQILDDLLTRLNADPPTGVPDAVRERVNPFEPGSLPKRNLCIPPTTQAQEIVERIDSGRRTPVVRRVLRIGVECYAAGSTTEALDDMLAANTAALVSDESGELWHQIEEESTTWEVAPLEQDFRKATQIFRVTYTTQKKNQALKA